MSTLDDAPSDTIAEQGELTTNSITSIPLYQIDAFANKAFEGNPAAVCFLSPSVTASLPDTTLQAIAAENNLSETAFLTPNAGSDFSQCTRFHLRWFTPSIEVPLCGHATLGAAAAIFACAKNPAPCLYFDTLSGELSVRRDASTGKKLRLEMDLPLLPPKEAALVCPDFVQGSALLNAALASEGTSALQEVSEILYEPNLRYLIVVLQGEMTRSQFESLQPDVQSMHAAHSTGQVVGVILTARASNDTSNSTAQDSSGYDFLSRFFGPWAGIEEDPVTGSAHSVLGPYWAARLGKKVLTARQCSRRGGDLSVTVNEESGRVVVSGGAVVVIKGELLLDS